MTRNQNAATAPSDSHETEIERQGGNEKVEDARAELQAARSLTAELRRRLERVAELLPESEIEDLDLRLEHALPYTIELELSAAANFILDDRIESLESELDRALAATPESLEREWREHLRSELRRPSRRVA